MPQRLRRAEQVERNREVVLDAALRVFLAGGYAGSSLEDIATAAGFSKGVVYSQFESKADLFIALLERRIGERAAENMKILEKARGRQAIKALLRAAERDTTENPSWPIVLVEFRAIAARDAALNRRYAALHATTIARLVEFFEQLGTPAFPPHAMAELVMALGTGTALERAANPNALPSRHLANMLANALGFLEEEEK